MEQLEIKIKCGDQEYVSVDYGWEGHDFVFLTKEGQEIRMVNAYVASLVYEGLDYADTETTFVMSNKIYERN